MSRKRIALFAALAILPVVLALWLAGFDVSYQLGNYVVTDNATVTGDVYQASAPTAGQVNDVLLDVGDPVEKGRAWPTCSPPARRPARAPHPRRRPARWPR